MTIEDEAPPDTLPDASFAKEFYAKYEVKDVLGRGVSSTVRRCIEKSTGQEFAVKIMELSQDKDSDDSAEELRNETKKEIKILRMCAEHENIINLHDSFEGEAFIFLIFELCKKGELFDYMTEVVTLSEKRTRHIMKQLLTCVEYIHERKIVHRDLKPENILLDDNLNVKLSDFGFAELIEHDEEITDLCGTPGYLAPEALKVSMYDDMPGYGRPVDMWASGVIMYTLLAGLPPFWHRKQLVMLRSIMEGQYSFDGPEWMDVGDNSKDLISKLLVVEPKERYTAKQALAHPFFRRDEILTQVVFVPRKKFRVYAYVVMGMNRLKYLHNHPPPINTDSMRSSPYSTKYFRKWIDAGAFRIYGHWVKKGDHQNRAALFENIIKRDMKNGNSPNIMIR